MVSGDDYERLVDVTPLSGPNVAVFAALGLIVFCIWGVLDGNDRESAEMTVWVEFSRAFHTDGMTCHVGTIESVSRKGPEARLHRLEEIGIFSFCATTGLRDFGSYSGDVMRVRAKRMSGQPDRFFVLEVLGHTYRSERSTS